MSKKLVLGILMLCLCSQNALGADEEQKGTSHESLKRSIELIGAYPEGHEEEQRLRKHAIAIVQKRDRPPAIPEEARRYFFRGQAATKNAESVSDFHDAVMEYKRALLKAPWWADAYYNLALVQERTRQFDDAIKSFQFYLLAAPDADDARTVRDKIYELEYQQEK